MVQIIAEPCFDYQEKESIALSISEKDGPCTVSEFIQLLEEAKEKFGDKIILIHDMNDNIVAGISHVYLNHGFDEREEYGEDYYADDAIHIAF